MRKKQETIRNYDAVRRTTCCNCPAGCGMKAFLQGGDIIDVFGDEEHPINKGALCPKGLLASRHLKNPQRLAYPQTRDRLDQPFKRAAWDEAMAAVGEKIQEAMRMRGMDSIFIHGDESAPFEYCAAGDLFASHFGTRNTPYRFFPRSMGPGGGMKKMFGVPGSRLLMNSPRDWSNSRCIVLYRSDLAVSDPVTFGHILDARDRGTILIVIDSKDTVTASKATLPLRARPGSEAMALKGILHLLTQRRHIDKGFLDESVVAPAPFEWELDALPLEAAIRSSSIHEGDLEKAAALIGRSKPVQVIAADWNARRYLSDDELFLCGALVCLRGSVGIPGGGLNLMSTTPFGVEDRIPDEDLPASLSLEHILLGQSEIGALVWYGNPCARLAGGGAVKERLKNIPLIVHLSSYPNETFHASHVSLPMSSWLEYPGLVTGNNGRAIQWHHKVVGPPGECRSPLDFWTHLMVLLDAGEHLPWTGKGGWADAGKAGDFFLKQNPLTRAASIDRLDPEKNPPGGLLWPCIHEQDLEFENSIFIKGDVRGRNILFQRGQNYPLTDKRFPTPSGKVAFSDLSMRGETDLPEDVSRYPMVLITGLLVDYVEEYGYFVSDRDVWTAGLVVQVHPRIGKLIGIKNGQSVTLENERGSITAPVWLVEKNAPEVIWCPEGIDPYQPGFGFGSPRSLFAAPGPDSGSRTSTRVAVYKPGQDKMKTSERIARFLGGLREEYTAELSAAGQGAQE